MFEVYLIDLCSSAVIGSKLERYAFEGKSSKNLKCEEEMLENIKNFQKNETNSSENAIGRGEMENVHDLRTMRRKKRPRERESNGMRNLEVRIRFFFFSFFKDWRFNCSSSLSHSLYLRLSLRCSTTATTCTMKALPFSFPFSFLFIFDSNLNNL